MQVVIARHALDRVPLSLIIDDSTVLVNLNYFFMRDRNRVDGEGRRWEDVPVVHPESFTREFTQFCLDSGVRGKFSVVPCPAALGRIDEGLPLVDRRQQESWLEMCREMIRPAFDITPEMLTHTKVVDPCTCKPLEPEIWEQYDWEALPDDEDLVHEYIATACRILDNVGLTPEGVTSPGGFGGKTLEYYARVSGAAVRDVTGNPTPYFFKRISSGEVETPAWYPDRDAGTAVGEIIACTGDWTGSWTGYGEVNVDRYITADLQGGRLPAVIDAGDPAVLCSHWQGFYGLHDDDRRGFRALKTIVRRLRERDPRGERTRWRKPGAITTYACMREMAALATDGMHIDLDLPVLTPEATLQIDGARVQGVTVDGEPLRRVGSRAGFEDGTFLPLPAEERALVAFTPQQRQVKVAIEGDDLTARG